MRRKVISSYCTTAPSFSLLVLFLLKSICFGFYHIGPWRQRQQPSRRHDWTTTDSVTKRRRNIIDAFTNTLTTTHGTTTSNVNDSKSISDSDCPYSMKFTRYRIDLTTPSAIKQNRPSTKKFGLSSVPSIFPGFISPREQIEKERKSEGNDVVIEWYSNENTLKAYSTLWNVANRHLLEMDDVRTKNTFNRTVIACFPDASSSVVQNWFEIFTWMQQQQQILKDNTSMKIHLKYCDTFHVPRIELKIESWNLHHKILGVNLSSDSEQHHLYNHSVITKRTEAWVRRILVEQGICPFTKSVKRSGQGLGDVGVPVGKIAYHTSQASGRNSIIKLVQLQADIWNAIVDMILIKGPSGPDGISSILLAAPGFDDDFPFWAGPVFAMLEAGVVAAQCAEQVGVVCFHPLYVIPDGTTWPGFGQMHSLPRLQKWYEQQTTLEEKEQNKKNQKVHPNTSNNTQINNDCPELQNLSLPFVLSTDEIAAGGAWQRRTPHSTINVLRADQLALAENKRNSPALYTRNINQLVVHIGSDQLANDLQCERELT